MENIFINKTYNYYQVVLTLFNAYGLVVNSSCPVLDKHEDTQMVIRSVSRRRTDNAMDINVVSKDAICTFGESYAIHYFLI